jgi:error-prone DNA polymerase
MIAQLTGVSNAEADEVRRALGDAEGMEEVRVWFPPRALARGYPLPLVERLWKVIEAFASFGFCKAHAAAFALPTYQSAWLKTHWPAHFLAGVLTHDPGMYPKRLILDDVRQHGIAVLGLDVDASEKDYVVERIDDVRSTVQAAGDSATQPPSAGLPVGGAHGSADAARFPSPASLLRESPPSRRGAGYGIRIALSEVKGINAAEVERIVAARPYESLTDFWHRARVSRPIVERLVLAGGFDRRYSIDPTDGVRARGRVTRRDLLLQIAELERYGKAVERASRGRGLATRRTPRPAVARADDAGLRNSTDPGARERTADLERHPLGRQGVWAKAAAQSRATPDPPPVSSVQLALDLGDGPREGEVSGLPEMTVAESMAAELEILGLDVSRHVVDGYSAFLDELGVVRSQDLLAQRSRSELLVAGVKVATQTPPIRSGRRVIFLTLDDATGPVDATFFEDVQGPYAATVFHSWLLVVRGELRRTGHRGVSLRATGAWALPELFELRQREGLEAVHARMAVAPDGFGSTHPERRRVLVHTSGFQMSPYSDIKPAGEDAKQVARKLWHRSPGSAG